MAAAPIHGLVGKLPAHGDFVRRGGPPAVLAMLDRWLDTALGGAVAAGLPLDGSADALDGCCFAFAAPGGAAIATAIASGDSVGRRFPLLAVTNGAGVGFAEAGRWCAAAAAALADARDAGGTADAALAAIGAIDPPGGTGDGVAGWWRAGDAGAQGGAVLPDGAAFAALLRQGLP